MTASAMRQRPSSELANHKQVATAFTVPKVTKDDESPPPQTQSDNAVSDEPLPEVQQKDVAVPVQHHPEMTQVNAGSGLSEAEEHTESYEVQAPGKAHGAETSWLCLEGILAGSLLVSLACLKALGIM